MSRALVLGGGGPVGIAWEAGLADGLSGLGVDIGAADLIVGTSAGSVVGAQLALGLDVAEVLTAAGTPMPMPEGGDGSGMEALMMAMAKAATRGGDPQDARIGLGEVALSARTVPEADFVAVFARLADQEWPAGFACTAVDVQTGEFRVWDADAGVPLDRAVASSCAVPGVFPPITIDGRRYMDGGMRTALNADAAVGHGAVIAVSCFVLALPEGMSDPTFEAMQAQIDAEFDALRAAGASLEVIVPGAEFLDVSGWGLNLMDPSRAPAAYEAGRHQAVDEADRLQALWSA
jgi:NTE family protein